MSFSVWYNIVSLNRFQNKNLERFCEDGKLQKLEPSKN